VFVKRMHQTTPVRLTRENGTMPERARFRICSGAGCHTRR
jgi:hypothetical protein